MKRVLFSMLLLAFVLPSTAQSGLKGFLKGFSDVITQGAARNNSNASTSSNLNNNSSSVSKAKAAGAKVWREDLGYGGFVIVSQYPDGLTTRVRYRLCPNCKGTTTCSICRGSRVCSICNGRGGIVTAGYGTYIPCASCNRTGRCSSCNATGKCYCAGQEYPGYVIGGTSTIMPDGTVDKETVDYNGRSSSSGGNSSSGSSSGSSSYSSRSSCPKCHGARYQAQRHDYAAASSAGWMQPYHNKAGEKCSICSYATDHYHYPCTECQGHGQVKK